MVYRLTLTIYEKKLRVVYKRIKRGVYKGATTLSTKGLFVTLSITVSSVILLNAVMLGVAFLLMC